MLEALFLSLGPTNPSLAVNIHSFRKMTPDNDDTFRFIFRDLSLDNRLTISIKTDHSDRSLNIRPYYSEPDAASESIKTTISSRAEAVQGNKLSGIQFDFTGNGREYSTVFSFRDNSLSWPGDYREVFSGAFFSPSTNMNSISDSINDVIVNKKKKPIITVLREIDPDISDIALGHDGTVYIDMGLDQLIPANLSGEGIIRILGLLAQISNEGLTTIFVDEIENGLHYSAMNPMWRAVLRASNQKDIQLFAATHSYDCIKSYNDAVKSLGLQENARLFHMGKGEKHQLCSSGFEALEFAMENNLEVR